LLLLLFSKACGKFISNIYDSLFCVCVFFSPLSTFSVHFFTFLPSNFQGHGIDGLQPTTVLLLSGFHCSPFLPPKPDIPRHFLLYFVRICSAIAAAYANNAWRVLVTYLLLQKCIENSDFRAKRAKENSKSKHRQPFGRNSILLYTPYRII